MAENSECDYEAIVIQFMKSTNRNLDNSKFVLNSKLWETLPNFYLEKDKFYLAESLNTTNHLLMSDGIKMNNRIISKHIFLDKKLANFLHLQSELETKKRDLINTFSDQMRILHEDLQKLPRQFDTECLNANIMYCKQQENLYEQIAEELQNQISTVKESIKNIESPEIPNFQEVIKIIQKESDNFLGDSFEIQARLSKIRLHDELMKKEMHNNLLEIEE